MSDPARSPRRRGTSWVLIALAVLAVIAVLMYLIAAPDALEEDRQIDALEDVDAVVIGDGAEPVVSPGENATRPE